MAGQASLRCRFEALKPVEVAQPPVNVVPTDDRQVHQFAEARRAHAIRLEQTGLLTLGWPTLRKALPGIGAHARDLGVLASADDVSFLTRTELVAVVGGARQPIDTLARRRLSERQRPRAAGDCWRADRAG